jgi:hypothetical protein
MQTVCRARNPLRGTRWSLACAPGNWSLSGDSLSPTKLSTKIVLLAVQGLPNAIMASRLGTPRQIVSKWRKRFALPRLPGLDDPRGTTLFPLVSHRQVKALACELPPWTADL